MSDPRDAYRTRGGSMTRDELVEKVADVWYKEYEGGVGDRISVAEAVINVVVEECAKVVKANSPSSWLTQAEMTERGRDSTIIHSLLAKEIRALKSAPSEAKP